MPRINPTISDKAVKIYEALEHHVRGKFVSDAIEEKHARQQGDSLENRMAALEKKVEKLIERKR